MCGHAGFQATTKNHRKGTKKVQKLRHGPWTTPFETRRLFLLQLMSLFEYLWFMTVYDWLMTLSDLDEIQIHNSDVFLLVLLTEPHQEEFKDQSGEQIKTRLLNFVPFQWTSKGLVLPIELESTPSMNPTWSNMGNFLMLFFHFMPRNWKFTWVWKPSNNRTDWSSVNYNFNWVKFYNTSDISSKLV